MRQRKRSKDSPTTPEGVGALDDAQHVILMPNGRSTLVSSLDRLFGHSSEGVVARDRADRLRDTNPAFREMVGVDAEESRGQVSHARARACGLIEDFGQRLLQGDAILVEGLEFGEFSLRHPAGGP